MYELTIHAFAHAAITIVILLSIVCAAVVITKFAVRFRIRFFTVLTVMFAAVTIDDTFSLLYDGEVGLTAFMWVGYLSLVVLGWCGGLYKRNGIVV